MKNVRVLFPVYFNAPLGGLHAHVRAQCTALRKSGNHAVVMCKPGPFAEFLRNDGVEVLTTDYQDLQASIYTALAAGPYGLIHAHPFQSRKVGLAVADARDTPFVATYHGNYLDGLDGWHERAELIIAVCPEIRDSLLCGTSVSAAKVVTISNGVNFSIFTKDVSVRKSSLDDERERVRNTDDNRRTISFVSRLDPDKKFQLEVIINCWKQCIETRSFYVDWSVAGDGRERERLEQEAARLNDAAGRQIVRFHGWLDEFELAKLLAASDLAIGPGRCAIEAMACGTPAVAVGRDCYVGLVEADRFLAAAYTNFGDTAHGNFSKDTGRMFDDITSIIYDRKLLRQIGQTSTVLIKAYFDQEMVDGQLLSLYATLLGGGKERFRPDHHPKRSDALHRSAPAAALEG